MSIVDLWTSGATDAFGFRFRDVWSVTGWEEGCVSDKFVCWLQREPEPDTKPASETKQMELFA